MKTSNLVEWALKHDNNTRNNDWDLILKVWHEEGLHLSYQQQDFLKTHCSKPETIRRLRQKFQEQGDYLPSEQVEQVRYQKSVDTRQASQSNVKDLEDSLDWKPEAISWLSED
jgi:hypothetical protein